MTAMISPEDVQFFEENGYLHLKNVIEEKELASLRAYEENVSMHAKECVLACPQYRYQMDPKTGQNVLHRIDNVHTLGGAFLELLGNPVLLSIAEAIFGPNFLPYGLNLVIKQPGYGVSVPWHRDPSGFKLKPGINLGIYLDDATSENGMLYVVPGSHKVNGFDIQEAIEEHGFHIPGSIPVPAKAGDVVIHSENVLHGSRIVRAQSTRRVLYYCFRSIEEQLSRGGKYTTTWAQSIVRMGANGIRARANSAVGRGEKEYEWKLSPEYRVSLRPDEYVEMGIQG